MIGKNIWAIINEIKDINVEIGLSRVSGVESMFVDNLRLFHSRLLPESDRLSACLNSKDIVNFSISVHAMKSALATIGAMWLSATALELETASKNKDIVYCMEQFPGFNEKLLSLHEQLSPLSSDDGSATEKEPGDLDYLRQQVQIALAASDDFDNETGMEAIRSLLPWDFGKQSNALLESALEAFQAYDYNGAKDVLIKLT